MPLCGNNAPWGGVCGRIRPPGPSHRLGPRASKACPNAAVHSFGPSFQAGPKCLPVIPKGLAGIACQTFWYDWERRGCGALRATHPCTAGRDVKAGRYACLEAGHKPSRAALPPASRPAAQPRPPAGAAPPKKIKSRRLHKHRHNTAPNYDLISYRPSLV